MRQQTATEEWLRADELAYFWRRCTATHLAAITGRPSSDWDRMLDAYAVAGWDVHTLVRLITEGYPCDPAVEAEHAESSFAFAAGELSIALAKLRASIVAELPAFLRRLFR